MAVMAREAWTDHRLDDLSKRVDVGFSEMREEFRAMRTELRAESHATKGELKKELQGVRAEIKEEIQGVRAEMNEELRAMRGEIGALNRTVIQFAFAVVGTIFLGFMGTIAALVTLV